MLANRDASFWIPVILVAYTVFSGVMHWVSFRKGQFKWYEIIITLFFLVVAQAGIFD